MEEVACEWVDCVSIPQWHRYYLGKKNRNDAIFFCKKKTRSRGAISATIRRLVIEREQLVTCYLWRTDLQVDTMTPFRRLPRVTITKYQSPTAQFCNFSTTPVKVEPFKNKQKQSPRRACGDASAQFRCMYPTIYHNLGRKKKTKQKKKSEDNNTQICH